METGDLKEKLYKYIDTAQENQLKAMYALVEMEDVQDIWQNQAFIDDLTSREALFLANKTKKYTIEQTMQNALKAISK